MNRWNVKFKNTLPFILAPPKMKHLYTNLTKNKTYMKKTTKLIKEIKELNKLRDNPCSWIGVLKIVKMSAFPQLNLQIQFNVNQNPTRYFMDINKSILKFIWRGKRPTIANTVLKEQSWRTDAI